MAGEIREFLGTFLSRGACRIGQIHITPDYSLCHVDDASQSQLEIFKDAHDAIGIARYDDAGQYRALKTAPNLRHGWRLTLTNLADVCLALDFLYPAALGTALAFVRAQLTPVNLRETLARQSGMYAVVRKITDEQAQAVVAGACNHQSGCLRHILWSISPGHPTSLSRGGSEVSSSGNEIPLLCAEACNLLIAEGRKLVKPVGASN
jgi:sirohydrochlorin cobaltochelatase